MNVRTILSLIDKTTTVNLISNDLDGDFLGTRTAINNTIPEKYNNYIVPSGAVVVFDGEIDIFI